MKKLINDPHEVVREALEGFQKVYPHLVEVHFDPTWVGRASNRECQDAAKQDATKKSGAGAAARPPKVAVLSGGGSGHEPLHAGYVGLGMLDAAVPGPVFTSPTPDPILEATQHVDQGEGVLYIVKNYTGDVLNFETAAELADLEGTAVRTVVVNDDVAVEDSTHTAGRRGVAGTVLVEKVAGAAAEAGLPLDRVEQIATEMNSNVRSMGVALGPCTVPHAGKASFSLGEGEVEMGVGIHGEPGYRRGTMQPADDLTEELYVKVRDDLRLAAGEKVIALVNGMGGTPESELFIVYRALAKLLENDGIIAARSMVGNYVTSLEMPGMSVTLARVDDEMLGWFDAPAVTPAWKV